ncbi:MAG: polysaccharide biosynthesis tyrosine autokinase [Rikenellaceae bacterium]
MGGNDKSYLTIRDVWEMFIGNLWIFIGSILVCLSVGIVYIVITPPVFTRTASILIKSESAGKSNFGDVSAFENMGLVQYNTDINNEMLVLTTPDLMEEVVKRLSLNYNYAVKFRNLRWVDLYGSSPFKVVVDDALVDSKISFVLNVVDDNSFNLEEFKVNGVEIEVLTKGEFNKPIACGAGEIVVAKSANLSNGIANNTYSFSKTNTYSAARGYASALNVRLKEEKASIIDMSITLGSTAKATDILNTLISVYNENWIKDKNLVTLSTTNFINERLDIIGKELGAVDESISNYKSENLLPNVEAVAGMNLQSSNEILKQQIALNNQLSMAKYTLEYIEDKLTSDSQLPINSGIESAVIAGQIAKYNELLIEKNALLMNSSVKNPIVSGMISDLSNQKESIVLSLNDHITTLQMQIKYAQEEELLARQRLSNNPNQELYLLSTGREQTIKEGLYLYLLQKREENELNQAFTAYNTKILSYAQGSDEPVEPQRKVVLLLSLVIGIALPILFLIVKSGMNVTVNAKEDLNNLTIPFLGVIPLIKPKRKLLRKEVEDERKIISINKRDNIGESLRMIRTNLDFIVTDKKECRSILTTSFHPKSGKSFISINLAISLASKQVKVLAIDGDFRRGTLSSYVDSPKLGCVNFLNGKVDNIDSVIIKGSLHPNLDVLPMGTTPPNPTELLLTDKFSLLIEELKGRYDYILFDCPPIEIVPDASIIEKHCDTTIFVVRSGLMDKRELPELQTLYDSKRVKNMCLVLNGVDYTKGKYGYGRYGYGYGKYGYGYGHRYGYGYGSEK